MSRITRHLELSLLLAVAPLLGACDGPEERHCVGPDGVYLAELHRLTLEAVEHAVSSTSLWPS